MFTAKQIFLGRSAEAAPTARSYVQDGLIAMWDGIENSGWGVHDAAATVWKDLISGMTLSDGAHAAQWNDNSFVLNADNWGSWTSSGDVFKSPTKSGGVCYNTAECVFEVKSGANNGGFFGIGIRDIRTVYSGGSSFQFRINTSMIFSRSGIFSFSVVKEDRNVSGVGGPVHTVSYRNAEVFTQNTSQSHQLAGPAILGITKADANVATVVHWHSLRFYDKMLTAEEIAANYAIDKERFNLP